MEKSTPEFIDNRAILGREDKFTTVSVAVMAILASWKDSLFAHEWLTKEGRPKSIDQLSDAARAKRAQTDELLAKGSPLERPVLGLGIMDNLEIGAGKDVLMTLAAHNIDQASVHIPKSHIDDFKIFIRS